MFVNNLFRAFSTRDDQMENWKLIATEMIEHLTNEHDFLSKTFNGPETWVFAYDSMIKSRSHQNAHSNVAKTKKFITECHIDHVFR